MEWEHRGFQLHGLVREVGCEIGLFKQERDGVAVFLLTPVSRYGRAEGR